MPQTYLTHARVVLGDTVLDDASVLLEDDRIRAINPAAAPAPAN